MLKKQHHQELCFYLFLLQFPLCIYCMLYLPSNIHLKGFDRKNLMLDLTKVISSQMNVNMKSIHIDGSNGIYEGNIILFVASLDSLNSLISKLKKIPGIKVVERVKL